MTVLRRLLVAGVAVQALALSACAGDSPVPGTPDLTTDVDVDTAELKELRREAGMDTCPELCGERSELPWFEQLHQAAGDNFPSLDDPDALLRDGGRGLPLLYHVDEDGTVTLRRGQVDSYDQVEVLVEEHTGVPVARG